jgi:cytidylate kinase
MRARGIVVAVDGPSGAGKSTAARALAARLGYTFVDTGAMYRALALKARREGVSLDAEEELAALLRRSTIELIDGGAGVALDGVPVTQEVRTREISASASRVSVHPSVRRAMVARQRELGREGGVVVDGRDIGTAVFPDAEAKFYVDAAPRRRAERRRAELIAGGAEAALEDVLHEVLERDHKDMSRSDSPLTRSADAVAIDTSELAPEEVVRRMLEVVRQRRAVEPAPAGPR